MAAGTLPLSYAGMQGLPASGVVLERTMRAAAQQARTSGWGFKPAGFFASGVISVSRMFCRSGEAGRLA
jgi:hypothetical protein